MTVEERYQAAIEALKMIAFSGDEFGDKATDALADLGVEWDKSEFGYKPNT